MAPALRTGPGLPNLLTMTAIAAPAPAPALSSTADEPAGPGQFQVVLICPDGYAHSGAFMEMIDGVYYGLRALGAEVSAAVNRLVLPGPQPIIFGANLLEPHEAPLLPSHTIVYNLEQISATSSWCSPHYLELLKRCRVWDYSARNLAALQTLGLSQPPMLVPVGYVPQLTRVPAVANEYIDVLFYGSMNPRRAAVINDLRSRGLNVHTVFGVYGTQRDALIARAKVVLNLHYYETSIFEMVRVSYLLANRKAVVAECHAGTEVDEDMADAVALCSYEELADTCAELVKDHQRRRELADRGFAAISRRDESAYLAAALAATSVKEKEHA